MFGRRPKLPIDLILNDGSGEIVSHENYAQRWEKQMKEAYEIVKEKSAARKQKDADRRKGNMKKILGDLSVGDRVLVKNVREKGGPGKLRSYWEQKVFVIKEKKGDVVYSVLEEGEKNVGKMRVLHRNMLLPVDQWFQFEKPSRNSPRKAVVKKKTEKKPPVNDAECSDSEEEDGEWVVVYTSNPCESVTTPGEKNDPETEEEIQVVEDDMEEEEIINDGLSDADTGETVGYDEEEGRRLLDELRGELSEQEGSDAEQVIEQEPNEADENVGDIELERTNEEESRGDIPVDTDGGTETEREGERQESVVVKDRETRERHPPKKFTYETLGVPTMVDLQAQNLVGNVQVSHQSAVDSSNIPVAYGQFYESVPVGYGQSYANAPVYYGRPYANVPVVYGQTSPYMLSSVPVYGQYLCDSFVSVDSSSNQSYPVMSCASVVAPVATHVVDRQTSTYPVIGGGASGAWNAASEMTDCNMDRTDRLTANMPELYSSNLSPSSDTFIPGSVRSFSN